MGVVTAMDMATGMATGMATDAAPVGRVAPVVVVASVGQVVAGVDVDAESVAWS